MLYGGGEPGSGDPVELEAADHHATGVGAVSQAPTFNGVGVEAVMAIRIQAF
jgi:hypothetical protein